MPFCGLVSLRTSEQIGPAEAALEDWVSSHAHTVAPHRGAGTTAWCFALGATNYRAVCRTMRDGTVVGHVPDGWNADDYVAGGVLPAEEFAFAVVSTGGVRLVRDLFGARALFYVHEPGRWVAFASLPEPLLALPRVREELDEESLTAGLLTLDPPPAATMFRRLRRVPAAHEITVDASGERCRQVWSLSGPPTRPIDTNVPVELIELLTDATRRRVEGAARIGTQLSGGLDSSVTTALVARTRPRTTPLTVLHVRSFDEVGNVVDPEEDRLASELVATIRDAELRIIKHGKQLRPYFMANPRYTDRPLPDMVFLLGAQDRTVDAAADSGCTHLVTGWGGDQMTSFRYADRAMAMLEEGDWRGALRELRSGDGVLRNFRSHMSGPIGNRLFARHTMDEESHDELLAPFRGRLLEARVVEAVQQRMRRPPMRTARRRALANTTIHAALELYDWMGQHNGIAVLHPLLDRAVVEYCDSLPAQWMGTHDIRRRPLQSVAASLLPAHVAARSKVPLPPPAENVEQRQRMQSEMRDRLHRLAAEGSWLLDYIDLDLLAKHLVVSQATPADRRLLQMAGVAIALALANP